MSFKLRKGHIVIEVKDPVGAQRFFPGAKTATTNAGTHICAIPHTFEATTLLRNRGLDIPSPITTVYNWPGRFTPLPHQIETAAFLTLNPRCFCLNGMGTMKTMSSLWAADFLMKQGRLHRCLIISPLSTLERVWGDELFFGFPRRSVAVLHGSRAKRLERLEQEHDFYIVNHDGAAIIADALAKRPDIDLIILDEGAVFRNAQTKKWKVLNNIINKQGPRMCWELTGTPTPNGPTDAYAQAKLIKPENYRGYFKSFREEVMWQVNQFTWLPRKGAEQVVNQVMSPSIRYALDDCVNLPPTIRQDRVCDLSKTQMVHYKELMQEAVTLVGDSQITAVNAAVLVNKLIQTACGCMYDAAGQVVEIDFGPRLALLREIISECNEKIIIFVPLTGVLHALKRELEKDWTVEIVDGGVSSSKRNKIFSAFQQEKNPRIILANAGAMAHGLTLTAASTIIWYAPINSNETYTQANARIVRPGQKNTTNIIHMYATTGEARTYKALAEKTRMQDVVLELARAGKKNA